jgi:hypothetical protein
MKTIFKCLFCLVALVAMAFAAYHHPEGIALAAFVPLMPKNIWGQPGLNRAIKLNDGTWGAGGEFLSYPIYDRLRMNSALALNARSLFANRVGSQRENVQLTYADTNIQKSESTSSSEKYELYSLQLHYMAEEARTDAEIASILAYVRTTFIRFNIDNKVDMFILPLWKFFGATQLISAPAVTINSQYPNAIFSGKWEFPIPIVLEALTTYELIVQPLVASAATLDNDFIGFEFETEKARK